VNKIWGISKNEGEFILFSKKPHSGDIMVAQGAGKMKRTA